MKESCGLEPREVVHMMLVTQYLDVLKEFAQSGKATMVVPHGMSAVADMEQQVRVCAHECVCVCDCKLAVTPTNTLVSSAAKQTSWHDRCMDRV